MIVEHIDDSSPSGIMYNLYLSDSEGASYSLALQDLAYSDTNRGMRFDLEYVSEGRVWREGEWREGRVWR